jgi:hypothetical protein
LQQTPYFKRACQSGGLFLRGKTAEYVNPLVGFCIVLSNKARYNGSIKGKGA